MTDSANFSQLWPGELIEQATDIIMNRFDLDPAQALGVLRRMSQHARTQMCVVAEAVINNHAPVKAEAKYFVFKAAHG
jgi:AmiR/NasT family two-component response regulator